MRCWGLTCALLSVQCVASKFDQFSPESGGGDISVQTSFEFKLYAASIVARLPFNTLDGPLFFIHHVHKIVTVLAGGCLEGLWAICHKQESAPEESVERWRQEGACIALLLSVQDYLQREYAIKTDRVKKFLSQPDNVDKTARTRSEEGATFRPVCLFQVRRPTFSRRHSMISSTDTVCRALRGSGVTARTCSLCR